MSSDDSVSQRHDHEAASSSTIVGFQIKQVAIGVFQANSVTVLNEHGVDELDHIAGVIVRDVPERPFVIRGDFALAC